MAPVAVSRYEPARHGRRRFQGIPGIEAYGKGKLAATWYGGGQDEGPDNFLMLCTSADGGDTWSDVLSVVDPPGTVRAFDPGLWRSPEGSLYWFWSQSRGLYDGRAGVWLARGGEAADPGDPGSWEPPVRIANGVMMNKPTVLSQGGPWLFPTAVWNRKTVPESGIPAFLDEVAGERFPNLLSTGDGCRTFALRTGPDVGERSFDEHMTVERSDGSLVLFVRTFYGIAARISDDQGVTWRRYVEGLFHHDVFRAGPSTRFHIRKLPSGRWLLVYHEHPRKRCRLTAYLSDDEGRTWSDGLLLDERTKVSYPDAALSDGGYIQVVYDRERHADQEILSARITERDILEGAVKDSCSRLRIPVNRGDLS